MSLAKAAKAAQQPLPGQRVGNSERIKLSIARSISNRSKRSSSQEQLSGRLPKVYSNSDRISHSTGPLL